jgi:hypothetical protein
MSGQYYGLTALTPMLEQRMPIEYDLVVAPEWIILDTENFCTFRESKHDALAFQPLS